MIKTIDPLSLRMRRLDDERLYCRQGWRVPVRRVKIHSASKSRWPAWAGRFSASLKEWLLHPLFTTRV